ncbi:aldo/keto reductase [Pseudoalteromonas maricaloris]|uniref:aldo/keto reductase n=1 Tax=Pseudoalteromonas maricaloris TaxID=184924 RepID=UPI003C1D72A2
MTTVVVIQARTNSSRLPGKVLLPINGVPLVVCAAKRAANTGLDVMVVTSTENSDDILCSTLESYGVNYYRGDLRNTLKRFVCALEAFTDETVVVRLTGDNVVPDGKYIEDMLDDFHSKGVNYLTSVGQGSGLPYGLSAEITTLASLREAHTNTECSFDTEHVTPYIKRKYGCFLFDKYASLQLEHLSCTIDNFDDYLKVSSLFQGKDREKTSFLDLTSELKNRAKVPVNRHGGKMALGTAQLGLDYGVNNSSGMLSEGEALKLLKLAAEHGVTQIDTASSYGESEKRIGQFIASGWNGRVQVTTKLFLENRDVITESVVDAEITKSLLNLKQNKLDCLMAHRLTYLTLQGGVVWRSLLKLQKQGLIAKLGVSIQSPDELKKALAFKEIEVIQMPFNILDWRWEECIGLILRAKSARSLKIVCRSVLLQGLLLTEDLSLWKKAGVENAPTVINKINTLASTLSVSKEALCIQYVASQPWVDEVVIGVESEQQLVNNLNTNFLSSADIEPFSCASLISASSLNPATWN